MGREKREGGKEKKIGIPQCVRVKDSAVGHLSFGSLSVFDSADFFSSAGGLIGRGLRCLCN
jgi:hypothetical protein